MTKIIFSVLFPLLQIYLVTVPLKVIDFFLNYFMSSSFFSEKGKPKFLRYLKLQNVSLNTVKLTFWQHVIFSLQRTCLRYTVPWFVLFLNFSSKKRKQCINIKKGQPLFHCHLVHHGHLFLCSKQLTKCNIHITGLIL